MKNPKRNPARALTLIEILVVVAVLAILMAVLIPNSRNPSARASRIQCVNNLKQIGLAFREWQLDQSDKFPMQA